MTVAYGLWWSSLRQSECDSRKRVKTRDVAETRQRMHETPRTFAHEAASEPHPSLTRELEPRTENT